MPFPIPATQTLIETIGKYKYVGEASASSLTSDPAWVIFRLTVYGQEVVEIQYASGDKSNTHIWDNKELYFTESTVPPPIVVDAYGDMFKSAYDPAGGERQVAFSDELSAKVDKVTGKGLSTEDYTTAEKNKLGAILGANTGDEDATSIKSKLGITTLSGSNTGDETESSLTTKLSAFPFLFDPSKGSFEYEDFNQALAQYSSSFTKNIVNSGSVTQGTMPTGSLNLNTNTSPNGGAGIRKASVVYFGFGTVTFECSVIVADLDSANNFLNCSFGVHDGQSYIPSNGFYFLYNNAYGTGANWVAANSYFSGGRVARETVTSVPVVAATAVRLKIIVTNLTEAKFYINGVLVATHTDRMPANSTGLGVNFMARQGGSATTNRIASVDYYTMSYILTTPR